MAPRGEEPRTDPCCSAQQDPLWNDPVRGRRSTKVKGVERPDQQTRPEQLGWPPWSWSKSIRTRYVVPSGRVSRWAWGRYSVESWYDEALRKL